MLEIFNKKRNQVESNHNFLQRLGDLYGVLAFQNHVLVKVVRKGEDKPLKIGHRL